jgi:hypothetical protein
MLDMAQWTFEAYSVMCEQTRLLAASQWIQLVVTDNVWLTKRAEVRDRRRATDRNAYSRASQSRSVHRLYAI